MPRKDLLVRLKCIKPKKCRVVSVDHVSCLTRFTVSSFWRSPCLLNCLTVYLGFGIYRGEEISLGGVQVVQLHSGCIWCEQQNVKAHVLLMGNVPVQHVSDGTLFCCLWRGCGCLHHRLCLSSDQCNPVCMLSVFSEHCLQCNRPPFCVLSVCVMKRVSVFSSLNCIHRGR